MFCIAADGFYINASAYCGFSRRSPHWGRQYPFYPMSSALIEAKRHLDPLFSMR
jgi:hypothetical protein